MIGRENVPTWARRRVAKAIKQIEFETAEIVRKSNLKLEEYICLQNIIITISRR